MPRPLNSAVEAPADLKGAKYINLYTYRRNGELVKTTVLALVEGREVLVHTGANSGKVKRIRHRPEVLVQRGSLFGRELGPLHKGLAEVLYDDPLRRKVSRCCLEKLASYIIYDKILRRRSAVIRIRILD